MRGTPYAIRVVLTGLGTPRNVRVGNDFAGTVVAVGRDVKRFRSGDEVFGSTSGALAQYVTVGEQGAVAAKPAAAGFAEAAAAPIAGVTALQALRDQGHIRAGEKVLINGAAGGVGTFAVQLAKSFGAEVTGVCSTRNVERVRALGADHVVDYLKEDFTRDTVRYGLIVDAVGNRALTDYQRVLTPQGSVVLLSIAPGDWLGPVWFPFAASVLNHVQKQQFLPMLMHMDSQDLTTVAGLMQSGRVKPVIDRHYKLGDVQQAMDYLESGHTQGKLVIDVE
jgi:NADPH:quinone reductase-like Zn-dependent oxidoreductase